MAPEGFGCSAWRYSGQGAQAPHARYRGPFDCPPGHREAAAHPGLPVVCARQLQDSCLDAELGPRRSAATGPCRSSACRSALRSEDPLIRSSGYASGGSRAPHRYEGGQHRASSSSPWTRARSLVIRHPQGGRSASPKPGTARVLAFSVRVRFRVSPWADCRRRA